MVCMDRISLPKCVLERCDYISLSESVDPYSANWRQGIAGSTSFSRHLLESFGVETAVAGRLMEANAWRKVDSHAIGTSSKCFALTTGSDSSSSSSDDVLMQFEAQDPFFGMIDLDSAEVLDG